MLSGYVNPNNADAIVHFEYGPTTAYGTSTPNQDAGSGNLNVLVQATIAGFSLPLHFRLVATNSAGTTFGNDQVIDTTYTQEVRVREYPPLQLSVNVATPSGYTQRWGHDDPNPNRAFSGLGFSTTVPGGFEHCDMTLTRDPQLGYPDLDELETLDVRGAGGRVAWEGRLESTPRVSGDHMQISPGAVGWQSHLTDDGSASMIYIDRSLSRWSAMSLTRQIALANLGDNISQFNFAAQQDPTSGAPGIFMSTEGPMIGFPTAEIAYDAGQGNKIAIFRVFAVTTLGFGWPDANNRNFFYAMDNLDGGGSVQLVAFNPNAPTSGSWTLANAKRVLDIQHQYNSASAGAAGTTYGLAYKLPSVIGDHGLALQGATTDVDGFLASDIVRHAIAKWAPRLATMFAGVSTITPSSFTIQHLVFLGPTNAAEILKQASRFDLQDWAVWEGPTFWWYPRNSVPPGKQWRARVGPSQLNQAGPQVDRIWNGVIVQYADVAGVTRTVGPPGSGADVTDASLQDNDPTSPPNMFTPVLKRWTQLNMNGTSVSGAAIKVGQIFLAQSKIANQGGSAILTGYVQDDKGVNWPAWMVRGGDQISFVDARDTSYRRIVSTNYSDDSKVNSITLDNPPDSLQAILERLQVVLVPIGIGG